MRLFFQIVVLCLFLIAPPPLLAQESDDFSEDEFGSFEESNQLEEDEFSTFDEDEFSEFVQEESSCANSCNGCGSGKKKNTQLWWVIFTLIATAIAGILVRFKSTRNLRAVFLLVSLVLLGFYKGGCPCPIMSLQHIVLAVFGEPANWKGMVWFLGLIPITYLFGKVWCGWICHLGALQEFIFLPGKIKVLQTAKAQKIMRIIRIVLLVALLVQLAITKTNLFKTIDPFKVAFNFRSSNLIGWILLGLTLVSSVFIYRPFCKTICPIGLILGWVAKIPGAAILAPQKTCVSCANCNTSCSINAITRDNKISMLDNQECIACGNCVTNCKKDAMLFVRNSKKYGSKTICE